MKDKDYELFGKLLSTPGFFIGFKSVERAVAFMIGYAAGRGESNSEIYNGFSEWLREGYGVQSSIGWERIVKLGELSEESAFDRARDLWFRYLSQREQTECRCDQESRFEGEEAHLYEQHHLELLIVNNVEHTSLLRCPSGGVFWRQFYELPEMHGGGIPILEKTSKEDAKIEFCYPK